MFILNKNLLQENRSYFTGEEVLNYINMWIKFLKYFLSQLLNHNRRFVWNSQCLYKIEIHKLTRYGLKGLWTIREIWIVRQTRKISDARFAKRRRSIEVHFFPDSLSCAHSALCAYKSDTCQRLSSGQLSFPRLRRLYRAASELQLHMLARDSRFFAKYQELFLLNLPISRWPFVHHALHLRKKQRFTFWEILELNNRGGS